MDQSSTKTDSTPQIMGLPGFLAAMYRYLQPYRKHTIALLLLLVVNLAFTLGWPLGFKFLIDEGITQRNGQIFVTTLVVLFVGVVIACVAGIGRGYLYSFLSANVLKDIRVKAFSQLQKLSMSFYSRMQTGDLMARFSSDLNAMENAVTWAASSLIMHSLSLLIGSIILFTLEWRLAALTLTGLLLCVISPRRLAGRVAQMGYGLKQAEANLNQTVQENITAQPVIKAFGLGRRAEESFQREASDLAALSLKFSFSADNVERIPTIIIFIFEILVIATRKSSSAKVTKRQPIWRESMGKVFTFLSNFILGMRVSDFTCGFKAFEASAGKRIFHLQKISGWAFDSEVLFLANRLGFRIEEIPVHWENSPETRVRVARDAISSFASLLLIRWNWLTGKYKRKQ